MMKAQGYNVLGVKKQGIMATCLLPLALIGCDSAVLPAASIVCKRVGGMFVWLSFCFNT